MWVFKMKDGDRHRAVNSIKTLFMKSLTHLARVLKPTSAAFYVLLCTKTISLYETKDQ